MKYLKNWKHLNELHQDTYDNYLDKKISDYTDKYSDKKILEEYNRDIHNLYLYASAMGYLDIIKTLTMYGNPTPRTKTIGLAWAIERNFVDIVDFLLNDEDIILDDETIQKQIIEAIDRGHLDVIKFIVDNGKIDLSFFNNQPLRKAKKKYKFSSDDWNKQDLYKKMISYLSDIKNDIY